MRYSQCVTVVVIAIGMSLSSHDVVRAQTVPDSIECERIVATARVDSALVGLFIAARRTDGEMPRQFERHIALSVGAMFSAPVPLRLSVFSGPARLHILRPVDGDTTTDLRAPTITSIVRVTAVRGDTAVDVSVVRRSLVIGFDSAVMAAVHNVARVPGAFLQEKGDDTMRVDIRVSTDSIDGAQRIISASFPRLPVVDAVPLRNPPAVFPDEAKADSLDRGEVVFRLIVGQSGEVDLSTIEVLRATSLSFVRAALQALPQQRFRPAKVKGCPVAQEIDYPFAFVLPGSPIQPREKTGAQN